ncbi:MAG: hypothetical protein AB1633_03895 [Elusimicrobiota bacterium]
MSKNNLILKIILLSVITLSLIPYNNQTLILIQNKSTVIAPVDFELTTPRYLYFIEPLTGLSDYFQSFKDIPKQLFFWLFWLVFFFGFLRISFSKILMSILRIFLIPLIFITTVLLLITFIPPKYKLLNKNPNLLLVDFHSHTSFSHDGLATPLRSALWHKKHNFDFFFVTDHSENKYFEIIKSDPELRSNIFPGEEVSDKNGTHLLILGLETPLPVDLRNTETTKIVSYVHKTGGAVVVAHWWHKINSSMEDLKNAGIDGFEIYGHEVTPLTKFTQNKIIEFCRKNNLAMLGGSNWHGWGTRNDVWTIFRNRQTLPEKNPGKKIIQFLIDGKIDNFSTLFIQKNEPEGLLKIVFEPFYGLFYYFLGLDFFQGLIWCMWIIAGRIIFYRKLFSF